MSREVRNDASLSTKLEILNDIDSGVSYSIISKNYDVSKATTLIKKQRHSILEYANDHNNLKHCRVSRLKDESAVLDKRIL